MLKKFLNLWIRVRNNIGRGINLLIIISFLLPFVSVQGCEASNMKTYYGFHILKEKPYGWLLILSPLLGLMFLDLSFLRENKDKIFQGFLKSFKATCSSLAVLIVFLLPYYLFLFADAVNSNIGRNLSIICWGTIYIVNFFGAGVTLFKVKSSSEFYRLEKLNRFMLLHVLYNISGFFFTIVIPSYFLFSKDSTSRAEIPWVLGFFSLPLLLLLYFADVGLKCRANWAIVWGILSLFFLPSSIIAAIWVLVEFNSLVLWLIIISTSILIILSFWYMLPLFKECYNNYQKNRKKIRKIILTNVTT